uniref:Uncharacterized protein n=1 Tax=Angomonas deanei TaxID=59799 RepID=C6K3M4_9TRYP|nr:conserved hypothetical protein [Angomonas deanei]
MAYDNDRTYSNTGTLVNRERSAALPSRPSGDAARYTHTDERTHAKHYYERDGRGREVYATYYNSDDDPSFQARYNADGRRAFVSSTAFTFTSNGKGMEEVPQQQQRRRFDTRAPTAVVEEEPAEPMRRGSTRATPHAQPIVEEPDDDEDSYAYMEKARPPHREREHGASTLSRHHHHQRYPDPSPFRDDNRERQLYPLNAMMRPHPMQDFFADDFFFGPRDPFSMMDTMRQHMSRQRAAMFGGVDPFASFF